MSNRGLRHHGRKHLATETSQRSNGIACQSVCGMDADNSVSRMLRLQAPGCGVSPLPRSNPANVAASTRRAAATGPHDCPCLHSRRGSSPARRWHGADCPAICRARGGKPLHRGCAAFEAQPARSARHRTPMAKSTPLRKWFQQMSLLPAERRAAAQNRALGGFEGVVATPSGNRIGQGKRRANLTGYRSRWALGCTPQLLAIVFAAIY